MADDPAQTVRDALATAQRVTGRAQRANTVLLEALLQIAELRIPAATEIVVAAVQESGEVWEQEDQDG